ncbi:hypothetical protein K1T71_001507 [Dendrolimus kikuchii]|uniref:Uncharacterized protein n=1 Tax=Dendrolimus kikuchii TaxID=765133 RepID=A0ACC1DI53_9NEOP|nr:hypothetical protein K1T71_001507 [Dendrolimus kikuchii]
MEQDLIIVVSVFSAAWLLLFIMAIILFVRVASVNKKVTEIQGNGRMRVQKLKMESEMNHAFHNPALVPDEELSKRGYSMYTGNEDVESARAPSERYVRLFCYCGKKVS